jgi:hypothetical protein
MQIDATAFGHLCQIYYSPLLTDTAKKFMDEKTPNLVEYLNRIKSHYWPDWDHCLETLSLDVKSKEVNNKDGSNTDGQ